MTSHAASPPASGWPDLLSRIARDVLEGDPPGHGRVWMREDL